MIGQLLESYHTNSLVEDQLKGVELENGKIVTSDSAREKFFERVVELFGDFGSFLYVFGIYADMRGFDKLASNIRSAVEEEEIKPDIFKMRCPF